MSKWKKLDLSSWCGHPAHGQLTALRLVPPNSGSASDVRFDIGRFCKDKDTGRKLWWCGTSGYVDPVQLKKRYTIWWCPVDEFDEF